jgi:hypothetical protein
MVSVRTQLDVEVVLAYQPGLTDRTWEVREV